METLKNSFEQLKSVIISSNPNPWYTAMVDALGNFENEFNQYLTTISPTIEEPTVVEEPVVVEESTVVEEPVVKKTVKKTTTK
ncbi:hypothetical protein UFOVP331_75 [uncultured Caudovirales phage]|uniref:Uncharacterized protein n=1 Tax=uncultured Caudovirales phage TaxID=2100421 RepID=A0A6J5LV83_9CAUD|nr:hypothetical protein UFOVP331_75 [uncultured Caudovirales phage]